MYVRTSQRGLSGWGLGDTTAVQGQIVLAANKYGVDPALALAVAQQESGYQQTKGGSTLKSSAGALGVMQLMPATAAGLKVDPNNQEQNIDGGVRLLSQLLVQFNGDTSKALAAYNAGPGAVIKYGGIPPYPETQDYVSRITANYQRNGGAAGSAPTLTADASGSDYTGADDSPASLLSSLPVTDYDLTGSAPGSDPSYSVAGMVLSGSDLLLVGAAVAGVLVVSAIL